jgi:hypothetical protein
MKKRGGTKNKGLMLMFLWVLEKAWVLDSELAAHGPNWSSSAAKSFIVEYLNVER